MNKLNTEEERFISELFDISTCTIHCSNFRFVFEKDGEKKNSGLF